MQTQSLDMGLIGNCSIGILVDKFASIRWGCFPKFDGEPIFSALLEPTGDDSEKGAWTIGIEDFESSEQSYEHNTAILNTVLHDKVGNSVTVVDFTPRFEHYGRTYKPNIIIRKIIPHGVPRLKFALKPTFNDGGDVCTITRGSNHISYFAGDQAFRLTTNLSINTIVDQTSWVAREPIYMIFADNEPVLEPIDEFCERLLAQTRRYWQQWCRHLVIPYEWQGAVIRAAITLKLCAYEDTGAIIAAMTTSIPEAANSERNWDYRFCWLRDSYFTVQALNRLGVTRTMEQYLQYLVNAVATFENEHLQPVFCINGTTKMPERIAENLSGYRGMGPVRIGNQAAEQIQHDGYGAVILSVTQMFFDERILKRGDTQLFALLEEVGEYAAANYNQPDAGLWELRGSKHIHTFSTMMCWAGVDRLAKIAHKLQLPDRAKYWSGIAKTIAEDIRKHCYNPTLNSYTATWGGDTMDASLLLACELGFCKGDDPRFIGTVEAIEKELKPENSHYLFRYVVDDDFGEPENAFTICSFWYIDALCAIGRKDEARELFEHLLARRNHLGLLSEDIHHSSDELWGNFPQTYSMVGIINCARLLSDSWESSF